MPPDHQIQDQNKVAQLRELKTEMEQSPDIREDLFFFPDYKRVNGYLGTGTVWFAGEKPSTSSFPDSAVDLLYETLAEYGFNNAHLTDLSKECGPVPEDGIIHEEIARQRPYFRREVQVLEPELMIAMSKRVKSALRFMAVTDGIELGYVHHYSWANRANEDEQVLCDEVQMLAKQMGYI